MLSARARARDDAPTASAFALAGLARLPAAATALDDDLRARLDALGARFAPTRDALLRAFAAYASAPRAEDAPLFALAHAFALDLDETLAVALASAIEHDVVAGHVVARLQEPAPQARPTLGLLAHAFADGDAARAVLRIAHGNAVRCGLLQLGADDVPLPDRTVRVPLPTAVALRGVPSAWPGTAPIRLPHAIPLARGDVDRAAGYAARLRAIAGTAALVIRGGGAHETRAAATLVAEALGAHAIAVHGDELAGLAPWLVLRGLVPVFARAPGPGERCSLPDVPAFELPLIVTCGPDGEVESDARVVLAWHIGVPPAAERATLWSPLLGEDLARRVAHEHRQTAGRIAAIAAGVREAVTPATAPAYADVRAVARRGETAGLGAFAEPIADEVDDDALVMPDALREELAALVTRCRAREDFAASLGPSIRARYRPSVRALFVGPSGTGKTLAAAWLATRLGIPLLRVDLSAITSKYIGETEKNLGRLFTLAEHDEVVLLFDEADALFGKRTDIHDANDRFANAQTNYLLQRMETYDGIAVLTSNGRNRFDAAFARRFDAIVTFEPPGPAERRALWCSHLGSAHALDAEQVNVLAAVAELSGGQIRNAVLRAAVAAAQDATPVAYAHVLTGVASEYRKVSRQVPSELKPGGPRA